jgi:Ran GTPase-activating protein (RanGAP) involved in mRNA processing and transport
MSNNGLNKIESAEIFRDILRSNKNITALNLAENRFGKTTGAVECFADGLGSNSTLLKIDLSMCYLRDDGVSILAQTLGSRNKSLQKLVLGRNRITSTGVGVLLDTIYHVRDLPPEQL